MATDRRRLTGTIGELVFDARALAQNWTVAKPLIDDGVDRWVRFAPDEGFHSVQVKTVSRRNDKPGIVRIDVRKRNSKKYYDQSELDFWAVVWGSVVWLIPWVEFSNVRSGVKVNRPEFDKYKI